MTNASFSRRLLAWYDHNGRHSLPWKRNKDPYRIWVSEIMLQQTQVSTVIPFYTRFMQRFPTVQSLARAQLDSVLHLWTGLGYYARARNLHRAAQAIVKNHNGVFPRDLETTMSLPGIGRSTAGAILALAYNQRAPILDGNVKRVLARLHAIDTPQNDRNTQERMWALAKQHTPRKRVADYTQAIMDLGATLCTRTQPRCSECPVRSACRAYALGNPQDFPLRTKRKTTPIKTTRMLMIRDTKGRVLLQRRPARGVWGGLWGFPECEQGNTERWCRDTFGIKIQAATPWPVLRHQFSHFKLDITPIPAQLQEKNASSVENGETVWYNVRRPDRRGVSAPVKQLLEQLRKDEWPVW